MQLFNWIVASSIDHANFEHRISARVNTPPSPTLRPTAGWELHKTCGYVEKTDGQRGGFAEKKRTTRQHAAPLVESLSNQQLDRNGESRCSESE